VSSKNSPLYGLAKFLHEIIFTSIPKTQSNIANSFDLVDKLSEVRLKKNYNLISLDVVSFFTNIPLDLAEAGILGRWDYIQDNCSIPRDEFMLGVRFVLNSTFFIFDGVYYKQTFGTPMGSPLSPVIADIVLQDLENGMIETLPFRLPFFFRYVDDIVTAVPVSMQDTILANFNSVHPRLMFTMEKSSNNTLNFLDVTIINNKGRIEFDWYHKPTFSGRYLNYESHHPFCQKRGTVFGLVDRAVLLSHPRFHQKICIQLLISYWITIILYMQSFE